jgi:hypothetical protein
MYQEEEKVRQSSLEPALDHKIDMLCLAILVPFKLSVVRRVFQLLDPIGLQLRCHLLLLLHLAAAEG